MTVAAIICTTEKMKCVKTVENPRFVMKILQKTIDNRAKICYNISTLKEGRPESSHPLKSGKQKRLAATGRKNGLFGN